MKLTILTRYEDESTKKRRPNWPPQKCKKMFIYSVSIVHPEGIPSSPDGQEDIEDFLIKVPELETPFSQYDVQQVADLLVARHLT